MVRRTMHDDTALRQLRNGEAIQGWRLNRLCDLDLCGYERVITLVGTELARVERTWITDKGETRLREIEAKGEQA